MEQPEAIWVSRSKLKMGYFDYLLLNRLRDFRKETYQSSGLPMFRILTNHGMQRIVQQRPVTIGQLQSIASINRYQAEQYGGQILTIVKEVEKQRMQAHQEKCIIRAHSPGHQAVKVCYLKKDSPLSK